MNKKYKLSYLPLFERDLAAARDYIAYTLQNPAAALKLLEDTERVIMKRLESPLSFEPYHSLRERKHIYYRIRVKNYSVFYVVIGDVMEVRRFIYSKRNLDELI
ncbi:type II toxin-antitoxin system RelE/ParE family toxin [Oscillospiraceae bacterium OttesenSCG-928-F05]|nr:type II toxin-antitoxin system RelE/ParE family toxin [Oscillospiraceae bacterium OttesenSCG-928-F05]